MEEKCERRENVINIGRWYEIGLLKAKHRGIH